MRLRARVGSVVAALIMWAPSTHATPTQADPAALQSLYQQGERALAAGRYAEAERSYDRLRQLQPDRAEIHARLGLIYFQQGRFADAEVPLRRALKLNPALSKIDSLLAMSLSELGRHDEALPGLEKGFRQQSSDVALRRMVGLHLQRAYTDLDRDADAVAVALQLTRTYPDDPEVLYHTGRLFGNYAYLQTMKLSRVAPESSWLHQAAGEANESQGLLDDAIREYRQVLTMAPRRPGLHFRIGRVLLTRAEQAKGDAAAEAEALKAFEQELLIDPTNASAAYEIGEMQRKSGQLDAAIASFRRAVGAYPAFAEALVGLGRALAASGDPGAGLPHLRKAVAINPRDEVAFYQLAQVHRALGQEAEQQQALAVYERLRAEKQRPAATGPAERPAVSKQVVDPVRSE